MLIERGITRVWLNSATHYIFVFVYVYIYTHVRAGCGGSDLEDGLSAHPVDFQSTDCCRYREPAIKHSLEAGSVFSTCYTSSWFYQLGFCLVDILWVASGWVHRQFAWCWLVLIIWPCHIPADQFHMLADSSWVTPSAGSAASKFGVSSSKRWRGFQHFYYRLWFRLRHVCGTRQRPASFPWGFRQGWSSVALQMDGRVCVDQCGHCDISDDVATVRKRVWSIWSQDTDHALHLTPRLLDLWTSSKSLKSVASTKLTPLTLLPNSHFILNMVRIHERLQRTQQSYSQ